MIFSYLCHVVLNIIRGATIYNHFFNLAGCIIEVLLFTNALNIRRAAIEVEKELLVQSNKLKSRFFANISHEFRTPLTLIKSPVQLLRKSADEESNLKLDLIDKSADRMLKLVDELMQLASLDQDRLVLTLRKGNLQHFLNSLTEPFEYKARSENINFKKEFSFYEEEIYFDREILTKILVNLLSNSFKYHQPNTPIQFKSVLKSKTLSICVLY